VVAIHEVHVVFGQTHSCRWTTAGALHLRGGVSRSPTPID